MDRPDGSVNVLIVSVFSTFDFCDVVTHFVRCQRVNVVVKMIHSTTMSNHSKLAHSMATMHRGQRMSSQQIKSGVFCPGTLSQNRRARTSNKHVTLLVTSNTSVIHNNRCMSKFLFFFCCPPRDRVAKSNARKTL